MRFNPILGYNIDSWDIHHDSVDNTVYCDKHITTTGTSPKGVRLYNNPSNINTDEL